MKKIRFIAFILCVCMLAGLAAACKTDKPSTSGTSDDPAVLRMLYSVENTTLDYLASGRELEHAIACNIVDGLVEFDNHSNIVPGLATSWECSDDGLVWTFKIREGVYWYDNEGNQIAEVTANDWVSALQHVATPAVASGTYDQITIVKNVDAYFDGEITDFSEVGVKAIDKYTLEYTLNQPTPYFIGGLAYVCWLPAYGPLLEEHGVEFGTSIDKLYSCGAYILTEWEPQVKQTFVKNENNWDAERVYIDRIEKSYNAEAATLAPTMVLRDEIDFAEISNDILDDWKANNIDYLSKSREDAMWHYWYSFDFRPTYGDEYKPQDWMRAVLNSNFRHTIMSALDRKFIVQGVVEQETPDALLQNTITPANSCFTDEGVDFADMPAFAGIEENFYNLEKMEEYKAKAIEELTAKGVSFPITVVVSYQSGDKNYENECILVKQQLENALGTDFIKVELWAGPAENFLVETRRAGKYSLMRVRWGADYIDPQTWTDPFTGSTDPETGIEIGNSYNKWNVILDDELFRTSFEGITSNSIAGYIDEYLTSADFAEVRGILEEYYALTAQGVAEGVDIQKRFEKFAEAEALLINNAMLIPCYIGAAKYQATKLNIFEGPYAACGYAKLMYKGMKLQDHFISMEEYEANQAAWAKGEY